MMNGPKHDRYKRGSNQPARTVGEDTGNEWNEGNKKPKTLEDLKPPAKLKYPPDKTDENLKERVDEERLRTRSSENPKSEPKSMGKNWDEAERQSMERSVDEKSR